jgi:tetratricopeptide (TPR) repeat protein
LLFVTALLLLLAGCASVTTQPTAMPAQPEANPTLANPPEGTPQTSLPQPPAESIIPEPVPKPIMSGNQAVIALLDRAQLDTAAGQREAAGASLERALRIEPRNAWLWQELAQLRLTQGQYAQAISLAQKSISFAGRERRLLVLDWRVIGNARVAQGNSAAAEQAFKLATEFEQPELKVPDFK